MTVDQIVGRLQRGQFLDHAYESEICGLMDYFSGSFTPLSFEDFDAARKDPRVLYMGVLQYRHFFLGEQVQRYRAYLP